METAKAGGGPVPAGSRPLDLVLDHFAAEGVAVHAEGVGRLGQAAGAFSQDFREEPLLELPDGVVELDVAIDHLLDQTFEAIADHYSSSRPVRRSNASTYFARVLTITSSGSDGTGGCLFQR